MTGIIWTKVSVFRFLSNADAIFLYVSSSKSYKALITLLLATVVFPVFCITNLRMDIVQVKRHSSIAIQLIPQSFPSVTIHTVTNMTIKTIHLIHFDRYGLA